MSVPWTFKLTAFAIMEIFIRMSRKIITICICFVYLRMVMLSTEYFYIWFSPALARATFVILIHLIKNSDKLLPHLACVSELKIASSTFVLMSHRCPSQTWNFGQFFCAFCALHFTNERVSFIFGLSLSGHSSIVLTDSLVLKTVI